MSSESRTESVVLDTAAPPKQPRRASLAGFLGTLVEYYDFSVYAYLAVFFAPLFFATADPAIATLSALLVFASAFVVRPIGGIIFGRIGDLRGRRTALTITVLVMGLASVAIGLLPTYASIGVFAPVLLVLLRLLQGLSAGGELVGALTLVTESTGPRRRGLLSSLTPAGSSLGFALATGIVGITAFSVGQEAMMAWGWRIPFLLCLPLTLICLLVRLGLQDSPEFRRVRQQSGVERRPVREVLHDHKLSLILVILLAFAVGASGYVLITYVGGFLQRAHGFSTGVASTLSAVVIAVSCVIGMPLGGLLIDRFGKRPVFVAATVAMAVLAYPLFLIMGAADDILGIGLAYLAIQLIAAVQTVSGFLLYTSVFPTHVRYTGTALGHNVGNILGGGFAPYMAAQLVVWTGNPLSATYWMIAGSVVGVVAVVLTWRRVEDQLDPPRA